MLENIIGIVKKYVPEDVAKELSEDTIFIMEISSLELYSLIAEVEAVFGVRIKERELSRIETAKDIQEIIEKKQR